MFTAAPEKASWMLAEALSARGDEVSVVTLHPEKEETFEVVNNVRVYRLPMDNLYWPYGSAPRESTPRRFRWHFRDMWNWKSAKRVGRILDKEKPDVVNGHLSIGLSASAWNEVKKRGIRLVLTLHDYYPMCPSADMFSDGKTCETQCTDCKVMTLTRKAASRHVDSVVAVSNYMLNAHRSRNYFPGVPGSIIYNVTTLKSGDNTTHADPDPDHLVFGFIGVLAEYKGIRSLLESTRLLTHPNWRLRIAGKGLPSYVDALKAEFPDPRIEWLGFTDSNSYYESIHISVIPSIWGDPLPYVVIESHLHGRPIICSNAGGIPEAASFGKKVETYPLGDVNALAALMNSALANRNEWMEGGFSDPASINLFTEEAIVDKYHQVYSAS